MNKLSRRGLIELPLRSADQWIQCPIKSVSHRSCAHSLQPHDNSNISILILHLHAFLTICLVCLFLLLVVKEFKAVSGHNKYMGSLEGVTAIEKEKFPKNFWPDVSGRFFFFFFFFTSESHVSHTSVLKTLLRFILLVRVLLKCTMHTAFIA